MEHLLSDHKKRKKSNNKNTEPKKMREAAMGRDTYSWQSLCEHHCLFPPIVIHKLVQSSFKTPHCLTTNNTITESMPLIIYPIRESVPSYFSLKSTFLQLELVISGCIFIIDPKNLANVPFVVTPII